MTETDIDAGSVDRSLGRLRGGEPALLHPTALARGYRTGETDPVEVAELCLAAARETPGCYIALSPGRAREEAAASRERWRQGRPLGPLDGVPISWKDMFDLRGMPTTMGAEIHRHDPPSIRDAPVVAAASRAGMLTIGKTNLSEFAFSVLGLNPHFGTPRNPRSTGEARVPGGSSSGAAVAGAAGTCAFGMGSDTAGSTRVPAAFNGLVGYRSSCRRYPHDGLKPLGPTSDALGVLANSVVDIAELDWILADPGAPSAPEPLPVDELTLIVDVAVLDDGRVEDAVRGEFLRAVDRLDRAGVAVRRHAVGTFHAALAAIERHGWLGSAEALRIHRRLLESPLADRMDQRVRRRLLAAESMGEADIAASHALRAVLMRGIAADLAHAVLVTPTVGHPAPLLAPLEADPDRFAEVNLATLRLTAPASFLDLPSLSLPVGSGADGCWTGLHLSVPSGQDARLFRSALTVEAALRS